MSVFQAVILGIIQGITEFLPVSSSGHLILVPRILGWADQGLAFDAIVHLGTLAAVLLFFRKKLWTISMSFFSRDVTQKSDRRLGILLILSIIPAGLVGFFFGDVVETALRLPVVVAISLIFWGVALIVADLFNEKRKKQGVVVTELGTISGQQAIAISLAQAIALVPGTSRSGVTMTTGLFAGLSKQAAAEFSFLMSVPIIALAGLFKIKELFSSGVAIESAPLIAGFFAAALSGFFAIWLLLGIIKRWSFVPFGVYRIVIGILVLVLFYVY